MQLVQLAVAAVAANALYWNPVGREDLGLGQVRSVQMVKQKALPVLLARAGL